MVNGGKQSGLVLGLGEAVYARDEEARTNVQLHAFETYGLGSPAVPTFAGTLLEMLLDGQVAS